MDITLLGSIKEVKEKITKALFQLSLKEAHDAGVCIHCNNKVDPKIWSAAMQREYTMSGYCEQCWDFLFCDEDEESSR
mgnify:FL=1